MIVWSLFVILISIAAAVDLYSYRIPNAVIAALLVLLAIPVAVSISNGMTVPWFDHVAAGVLSLVVGMFLYGIKQMGAGDAKLLAVVALWSGIQGLIPLLFALAVSGLVVLLVLLVLRRIFSSEATARLIWKSGELPRVLKRKEGIPYGIGIALGTIVASLNYFPAWLWRI